MDKRIMDETLQAACQEVILWAETPAVTGRLRTSLRWMAELAEQRAHAERKYKAPTRHRLKEMGPPLSGWVWDGRFGCWRPNDENWPVDPADWFSYSVWYKWGMHPEKPRQPNEEEKRLCDDVFLAAVHDHCATDPTDPRINNGIWKGGYESVQSEIFGIDRPNVGAFDIRRVLARAKAQEEQSARVNEAFRSNPEESLRVYGEAFAEAFTKELSKRKEDLAASGQMNETEVGQVKEYADRVAELLEPMEILPIQPTSEPEPPGLDPTNRVAQRMADERDGVLHPLKVEYRKKVVAVLDDGWESIVDIFEHCAPQTLVRLGGWRQDILDHTDPARDPHIYWLEPRGGKFGPNADLKNRIENLAGKLRREAKHAETAASRMKTDLEKPEPDSTGQGQPLAIPGLIEKLKTLRSALDSRDQGLIGRARNDLKTHVGSAERLYDALQEPLRGSTAGALECLNWIGASRKNRTNTGLYPALLDALATPEFIAELERWQARLSSAAEVKPEIDSQPKRKSRLAKTAEIAEHLRAHPTASSQEISEATGIDASDVRHLWGPIRKALKEGKAAKPRGWRKDDGDIEAIDNSASCSICHDPIREPFECPECGMEIIRGECRTCHYTQTHPDQATP